MDRPHFESTVFDAAVAAEAARTAPHLIEALEPAFALLGFDYFRVVEAVSDGEARVLRFLVGKVDTPWGDVYAEERLSQSDIRIRRALASSAPFFLSEILGRSDVTDAERRTALLAKQNGVEESYVLPHRDADNRQYAAVLIGPGHLIDGRYRVAAHILSSALLLSALRIEAANLGGSEKSDRPALTIRQLQCLEWSRRGKSSADIGKILNLSPRTIDEHFAMACKVLEVRTRVQAVSTALALGLLPYRAADVSGLQRNP